MVLLKATIYRVDVANHVAAITVQLGCTAPAESRYDIYDIPAMKHLLYFAKGPRRGLGEITSPNCKHLNKMSNKNGKSGSLQAVLHTAAIKT